MIPRVDSESTVYVTNIQTSDRSGGSRSPGRQLWMAGLRRYDACDSLETNMLINILLFLPKYVKHLEPKAE